MKKIGAVLIAVVLLIGIGVALAVGGSSSDPLISLSYIEDTYLPGLTERLQKRASDGTKEAYAAAVARLDKLGEADVAQAENAPKGEGGYASAALKQGGSLALSSGGGIVVNEGACRLSAGTLADVTAGRTVAAGENLVTAHRYIVTSTTATLQMTAPGKLSYQGEGTVRDGAGDGLPFQDVATTDWFYSAVEFVYGRGYYSGMGENRFEPKTAMTRAMLATVLHRVSGGKERGESGQFSDIPATSWYADGVNWASTYGVVKGVGDGIYAPNDPVTREQMVTMLYRYLVDYRKESVKPTDAEPSFPDWGQVSGWAKEAVAWAVENGIVQGRDTGYFDPKGNANRAEVAAVLQRFAKLTEKS